MTALRRLHPAWVVLAGLTLCMLAPTGVRSVFGVYIKPMEDGMHWSRGGLSTVAALGLLLLGAAGPFAGRLADRWGPARVITLALMLVGVGSIASAFVTQLWHLFVTAGGALGGGGRRRPPRTGPRELGRVVRKSRRPAQGPPRAGVSGGR